MIKKKADTCESTSTGSRGRLDGEFALLESAHNHLSDFTGAPPKEDESNTSAGATSKNVDDVSRGKDTGDSSPDRLKSFPGDSGSSRGSSRPFSPFL